MRVLFLIGLSLLAVLTGCVTNKSSYTTKVNPHDRCAFMARTNFSDFAKVAGDKPGEFVFTSPEIDAPINWDELVASWNVPPGVYLTVEARAIFPDHTTKYFTMSKWSDNPDKKPRESMKRQRDDDGNVDIDTLILKRHGGKTQLRLTIGGPNAESAPIKFFGLSFCDSEAHPATRPANHAAWGKTVDIPQRHQADYEGGGGWCSPTSTSMVLAYWSTNLSRPELDHTVPETAAGIHDGVLNGTGNWPFNTAYAGSYPGMRAYVTRLDDITELEDWIAAGIAPVISVSSFINEKHKGGDEGHLIVCLGFTETGDVMVNDPGVNTKVPARKMYTRQHVIDCWKKSKNAVYLIYPETAKIPKNVYGHWADGN